MVNLLTNKDYRNILDKTFEQTTTKEIRDYVDAQYKHNGKYNENFWFQLEDILRQHYDPYTLTEFETDDFNIDGEIPNPEEKATYLYGYVHKKFEEIIESNRLENKKFKYADIPDILLKINSINRRQSQLIDYGRLTKHELNIYTQRLLELIDRFILEDYAGVSSIETPILKELCRVFFSTDIFWGVNYTGDQIFEDRREKPFRKFYSVRSRQEKQKLEAEFSWVFSRSFDTLKANNSQLTFNKYKQAELSKWRILKKRFKKLEEEYSIVGEYIHFVTSISDTHLTQIKERIRQSKGSIRFNDLILNFVNRVSKKTSLLDRKTSAVQFRDTILGNSKEPIYLYCSRGTAAYFLLALKRNFKGIRLNLSPSFIEKNKMIFVPTDRKIDEYLKIPPENANYILFKKDNHETSLKRFNSKALIANSSEHTIKKIIDTEITAVLSK